MEKKFQNGDEVAHKSDKDTCMTVATYTGDGKVICRWKEKGKFQREEFFEAELEKWEAPTVGYGDHQADMDNIRW